MAARHSEPAYTHEQLEAMTKVQLLELASSRSVVGVSSSMLKADIITAIKAVM